MKRKFSLILAVSMIFSMLGLQTGAAAVAYPEDCYEAESAFLNGASVNTDHTGYTGTGFVDQYNAAGDYVEFTINIYSAGDYSLIFRYANAGGYYASSNVYLDGEFEATAVFPSLADWNTWGTSEVGNYFTAGTHTVRIAYNNHAINLDNLTVEVKHESTRSFYLSNQQDMMAIWKAAKLCSADEAVKSPRIDEVRVSSDWTVNQIKDYSGFFRDETESIKYTNGESFDSEGYFDETGILRTNYLKYAGEYPSGLEFSRDYAMLPNMQAIVTRYTIQNSSAVEKTVNVLDMVNASNIGTGNISAAYNETQHAILFDRTASGQPYLAIGAFDAPSGYQAADDSISDTSQQNCSPWFSFDATGSLKDNGSTSAQNVSAAFTKSAVIPAGQTKDLYFYIALSSTSGGIDSLISTVNAHSGDYWFNYTQDYYANWFAGANNIPGFQDPELALMYKRNLVMIKNSLRPGTSTGDGAHAATTNPYSYGYKVWTRDASVTAIALDASGFLTEGGQYWRWLAARQLTTGDNAGSFNTCIDFWTNQKAEFIEPEHDTLGWFLYGVYRHCMEANSNQLRDDLWPQLTAAAAYISNNIDENGFGPQDFSIWEDMDNYGVYTYTQALYVAGLEAMGKMAHDKGLDSLADSYNGAASTIKTAINRDDTAASGLWNAQGGYYDKDIRWDNSVNRIKDAAGLILFVTGIVDIDSSRVQSTLAEYEADLTSDEYGLARFAMDTYYSKDSVYSPSGDEAVEVSPSWPQVANWNALCNAYLGNLQKASDIFNWNLHRTGTGYMVTGECVSDVTEKPCISTASEPTTAAAFILASLVWNGDLDMRIISDRSNAGCYRELSVSSGCEGDWSQYQYVPYYLDERNDAANSDRSIKNVYIANDANNLYIRIDNESGSLPGFDELSNLFRVTAYFQDAAGTAAALPASLNGTDFRHSFSYALTRSSDSGTVDRYTTDGVAWSSSGAINDAQAEWQTSTGRIEMKISLSALGITTIGTDTWLDTALAIGQKDSDSDIFEIHYRLTGNQQPWLYGNFE